AAVALVERVRLVERVLVEPARVLPAEDARPDDPTDRVVALVAGHRRDPEQDEHERQAHQSVRAHRADDEEERVAGQERHHDEPGLDEDDREQQRVDPGAVEADEVGEVDVDVEDEVEHRSEQIHASIIDAASKMPGYAGAFASSSAATASNQATSSAGCATPLVVAGQRRLSWLAAACSCQSSSSAIAQSSIRRPASLPTSPAIAASCARVTPASEEHT